MRLDPAVGREIQKTRPCLIVSPDPLNRQLQTVTGIPLTTGSHAEPFRPPVALDGRDGLILCDQLRTLSRERLVKRLGAVEEPVLSQVLNILQRMFHA